MTRSAVLFPSIFAVLSIAMLFPAQAKAASWEEGKLLRYKFQPDQIVRYRVSMRDDYEVQVSGEKDEPYSYQDSVKNYRVVSVNQDGSAELELTMEAVQMTIFQNDQEFTYNSQKTKSVEPMFAGLNAMIGDPHIRVKVTNRGEISDAKNLIFKTQNVDEKSLDAFLVFPEEPVKIGGFWTEDFSVSVSLPESQLQQLVKMQRRYFLKSVKDGIATITLNTKVITPLKDPQLTVQLIRRQAKGEITFDTNKGLITGRTITQDNQVVNFNDGPSLMKFKQKHTERLVPAQMASTPNVAPQ